MPTVLARYDSLSAIANHPRYRTAARPWVNDGRGVESASIAASQISSESGVSEELVHAVCEATASGLFAEAVEKLLKARKFSRKLEASSRPSWKDEHLLVTARLAKKAAWDRLDRCAKRHELKYSALKKLAYEAAGQA